MAEPTTGAKHERKASVIDDCGRVQPEMAEMSEELGTQLARLRLWFSEDSQIVQAFQKMLASCTVYALERGHPGTYAISSDQIQEEITQLRAEYLDAAREHLRSR
jgi:hypothetical protein